MIRSADARPAAQWGENILYLQLGQLSQLLGSVKDELSALEETEGEKDVWEKGGEEEGIVIIVANVGRQ